MIFIMKTLSCRDAGFDCDYLIQGETEEEIFRWRTACSEWSWNKKGRLHTEV